MKDTIIPNSYATWRHCIEVECGMRLEPGYIRDRLASLQNSNDHHTQQFILRWGDPHLQRIIEWFRQAAEEHHRQHTL